MNDITILAGLGKDGRPEALSSVTMARGELITIVGHTGSGKSRLIKDVEQLADGDSISKRRILLDGRSVPRAGRQAMCDRLVAHLGQSMRFVLDTTVGEFLLLHARCRGRQIDPDRALEMANGITPEPILPGQNLNLLSGGQSRALMIADIACVCDSPIVLIDEIENAGIDKEKAFRCLQSADKLVLVVTHDPHTALMAGRRIVMSSGAMIAAPERTAGETRLYEELSRQYRLQRTYQTLLRKGEHLA